mmetsp:Transcript_2439/g.4601  ORF Transcript_2439/g.4601 Transcript_2439/m.4601 type:complete len:758 (+) Transcript_2439:126-2399(+)
MTFSPTLGRNLQALNPLNLVNHHHGNTSPSPNSPVAPTDGGSPPSNNNASPVVAPSTPRETLIRKEGSTMVSMPNRPLESNAISQEVDVLYKEFEGFQTKLKGLVALYKDKHKTMKKLNDQMLGTARFYNEMFAGSPIHSIVTETGCSASLFVSAPPQDMFPDILMEQPVAVDSKIKGEEQKKDHLDSHREMIEETSYPDEAIFRGVKVKDPVGEKKQGTSVKVSSKSVTEATKQVNLEPEGDEKHGMSINAEGLFSDKNDLHNVEGRKPDNTTREVNMDPESCQNNWKSATESFAETKIVNLEPEGEEECGKITTTSLDSDIERELQNKTPKETEGEKTRASEVKTNDTSLAFKKKESIDPPSAMEYPHDEIYDDKNSKANQVCSPVEDAVNVIIGYSDESDCDDCSLHERDHQCENGLETKEGGEIDSAVALDKNASPSKDGGWNKPESEPKEDEKAKSCDEILESRSVDSFAEDGVAAPDTKSVEGFVGDIFVNASPTVPACDEPEIVIENGVGGESGNAASSSVPNEKIGSDLAMQGSSSKDVTISPPSVPTPVSHAPESYFNVYSAAYTNSEKFLHQHKNLVNYLEEWESTISSRVNARYGEYVKFRKNLHHYIKKVNSLESEHKKLEEKNKPIKPKQEEKMERNVLKLSGARETHDSAGESLILLLDEIVHRSWKDVFPLIKMSMQFEAGYSAMQAKTFERLYGTLEMLSNIGMNESLSNTSRLEALRTMNPEVLYTGTKGKGIGLPVLVE